MSASAPFQEEPPITPIEPPKDAQGNLLTPFQRRRGYNPFNFTFHKFLRDFDVDAFIRELRDPSNEEILAEQLFCFPWETYLSTPPALFHQSIQKTKTNTTIPWVTAVDVCEVYTAISILAETSFASLMNKVDAQTTPEQKAVVKLLGCPVKDLWKLAKDDFERSKKIIAESFSLGTRVTHEAFEYYINGVSKVQADALEKATDDAVKKKINSQFTEKLSTINGCRSFQLDCSAKYSIIDWVNCYEYYVAKLMNFKSALEDALAAKKASKPIHFAFKENFKARYFEAGLHTSEYESLVTHNREFFTPNMRLMIHDKVQVFRLLHMEALFAYKYACEIRMRSVSDNDKASLMALTARIQELSVRLEGPKPKPTEVPQTAPLDQPPPMESIPEEAHSPESPVVPDNLSKEWVDVADPNQTQSPPQRETKGEEEPQVEETPLQ